MVAGGVAACLKAAVEFCVLWFKAMESGKCTLETSLGQMVECLNIHALVIWYSMILML